MCCSTVRGCWCIPSRVRGRWHSASSASRMAVHVGGVRSAMRALRGSAERDGGRARSYHRTSRVKVTPGQGIGRVPDVSGRLPAVPPPGDDDAPTERLVGDRPAIGLFGGTFDPPHVGHLVTAVNVRHALGARRRRADGGQRAVAEGGHAADHPGRRPLGDGRGRGRATSPGCVAGRTEIDHGGAELHGRHAGGAGRRAPGRRAVHHRRRRRRRRADDVGALRRGRRPVVARRRRPPRASRSSSPTASTGSTSRCPGSRCRAPTCAPASPTAARSTTSSPSRCST